MRRATVEEIKHWLTESIAETLHVSSAQIDPNEEFSILGLTSIESVSLLGDLERWLGRPMRADLTYEYSTILRLSQYLANEELTSKKVRF